MSVDMAAFFLPTDKPAERERILEECAYVYYFKCSARESGGGGCGINISAEHIKGTTITCPQCGKTWSVVAVHWSGVK